ncbi:CpaD family pilus assembly protein [Rhizobiaceae bacterium n13]|uniref:CpaD family pilus assembly protein n=1 Tax=Ferirhizobium litorale TaxID=2927786 RepID=A0AAE3U3L3_9HYPH|nr:CpaD family pilus assembly protein [Fererhizobium litorale]MDI7862818.1 CpaD family pilus assembly protein [Fererhizobium litorale]MDI7923922.1 CpaD family pilus assembly protein [Fererhizobium litorale]
MPSRTAISATGHFRRAVLVATVLVSAAVLQSCGTRDGMTTGAIPDDYRTRHPITLTEVEHTLDVPIASGDRTLTIGMRDSINGFIGDYKERSSGVITIQTPRGSVNAGAASAARRQIRHLMLASGVPSPKIIESSYGASPAGDAAPIRLSFVATTAVTNPCGQWPEDLGINDYQNKNYYNFGCATQNNIAAQIANPMDLVTPRAISPIDAQQRSAVINTYRTAGTGDTD